MGNRIRQLSGAVALALGLVLMPPPTSPSLAATLPAERLEIMFHIAAWPSAHLASEADVLKNAVSPVRAALEAENLALAIESPGVV